MNIEPSDMNRRSPSLAYALGRKMAPFIFKANWIFKSLTGTEEEKIKAEYEMGWLLAKLYEAKVPTGKNITTEEKLQKIGKKLTACLRNKQRRFTFRGDESHMLNAISIPGGFVYVSEKMADLCREDDDALAFVLAHEMAHTINGDANKRFLTRAVVSALSQIRFRRAPVTPAVQHLLAHLIEQGYSREQEYAADRFAVALAKAAGFDPEGGCRLFEKLIMAGKESDGMIGAYFSSHPPIPDRIDRIRNRIQKM